MAERQADPQRSEPTGARIAWRRVLVLVLPLLYVAGTAVKAEESSPRAWLAIAISFAIAVVGSLVRSGETSARARDRTWTSGALSLTVASSALSEPWPWMAVAREMALLGAGLAAVRALGAIEGDPGLAMRATEAMAARGFGSPRWLERLAKAAIIFAWGSAAVAEALVWAGVFPRISAVTPLITAAASAAALFAVGGSALLLGAARRLELSAPPRALACGAAAGIGLLVALALGVTTTLHADSAAALGFAMACPMVVRLAHVRDALALSRRGRRVLTLVVFGGPVAALAAVAGEGGVAGYGLVAMVIAIATMAIGSFAPKLEAPLLPAKGLLLDALADATLAAHDRDTRAAVGKALARIREAAGHGAPSPELWILHPTRIYTVDAAGYLQERSGELAPMLLDIAHGEPGATLRVDVLEALQVRRPDLRPLLRWLEDRRILFATVIAGAEGEEPDGVVLVPAGTRSDPLTIEEVHAARLFADAFVAVCQARSARERHLGREQALADKVEALDDQLAMLRHGSALDASRNELASARLARPATVGIYSAPSRMAYDALERRIQNDAPSVVLAPAGVDPVPYIARAHLSGPRKERPLVIVDGTSSREHDTERWRDPRTSPLALADRGLLVLVDGGALPRDVQVLIARALGERRPPWERAMPLDVAVALTATRATNDLVESGLLSPELYARFEDASAITLPRLRERSEDLFSIVADRLAREGLRVHGRPIGIEAAAFARLVEHPFEGEEAELNALVTRLVKRATGDVVQASDFDAIGMDKRDVEESARSDKSAKPRRVR